MRFSRLRSRRRRRKASARPAIERARGAETAPGLSSTDGGVGRAAGDRGDRRSARRWRGGDGSMRAAVAEDQAPALASRLGTVGAPPAGRTAARGGSAGIEPPMCIARICAATRTTAGRSSGPRACARCIARPARRRRARRIRQGVGAFRTCYRRSATLWCRNSGELGRAQRLGAFCLDGAASASGSIASHR